MDDKNIDVNRLIKDAIEAVADYKTRNCARNGREAIEK